MANLERGHLIAFPRCNNLADLEPHLKQWVQLKNKYGKELPDDHLIGMLGQVIPAEGEYRHNDPRYSDCDRRNAHSHLQATLLGHSVSFGVTGGRLALGQFQAIIAAELDGPRERQVTAQIFSFA